MVTRATDAQMEVMKAAHAEYDKLVADIKAYWIKSPVRVMKVYDGDFFHFHARATVAQKDMIELSHFIQGWRHLNNSTMHVIVMGSRIEVENEVAAPPPPPKRSRCCGVWDWLFIGLMATPDVDVD